MPYEPTEWKSGDVVTSAKLNNMERGIASGGVLVVTDTEGTLDKTWQEIHDAAFAVIKTVDGNILPIIYCGSFDSSFVLSAINPNGGQYAEVDYLTNSANGYPVLD
jgi:hypothetical protein